MGRARQFYEKIDQSYGIFSVCLSQCSEDTETLCGCAAGVTTTLLPEAAGFAWKESLPDRHANVVHVIQPMTSTNPRDDDFLVSYDLSSPMQLDAVINILLITFVVGVMVVFGLVLSNSVADLALRPMERMLDMVRQIAR